MSSLAPMGTLYLYLRVVLKEAQQPMKKEYLDICGLKQLVKKPESGRIVVASCCITTVKMEQHQQIPGLLEDLTD